MLNRDVNLPTKPINVCVFICYCVFLFHWSQCHAVVVTETCFLVWNSESCLQQSSWGDALGKTASWEIFPSCFLRTSVLWWRGWKGVCIQRAKDNWLYGNLWTPEQNLFGQVWSWQSLSHSNLKQGKILIHNLCALGLFHFLGVTRIVVVFSFLSIR